MEVEELQMLELRLGSGEQFLGELDVVVHGAADVHHHQHLDGVAALGPHVDVEIGLARGAVDRSGQVKFVGRAFAGEFAQPAQRDFDVPRAQLHRVVEVAVLARIPDFDRAAVARLFLPDADALGVVAVGAEG